MYIILTEDEVQFYIYHTRSNVEVVATNKGNTVRVEARTRKEAIQQAKKELKEKASQK